jgi:hypothetical protein
LAERLGERSSRVAAHDDVSHAGKAAFQAKGPLWERTALAKDT